MLFLNGKVLYAAVPNSFSVSPAFLGIVNPENDAMYPRLKKGDDKLLLTVSELGGGGLICRSGELSH
jgi:hypothetical protein